MWVASTFLGVSPTPGNEVVETICTVRRVEDACDGRLDTPCAVEDQCICSSLHIHGNLVNVRYYHRCPVHNDTMEHDCTHFSIVTGQSNFVQFGELPISTPEPVEDACICSMLHIHGNCVHKYHYRCPVHNDTEEHNCTRRNTVMGRWLMWNNKMYVKISFLLLMDAHKIMYQVICIFCVYHVMSNDCIP